MRRILLALVLAGAMAGCNKQAEAPLALDQIKADLQTVSQARVFFGHQSVGRNMIEGLQALSAETGVPLRIQSVESGPAEGPGVFHANVGRNGAPDSKIAAFNDIVRGAAQTPFDAVVLKFCYVDLDDDSQEKNGAALFERYQKSVAELQTEQPSVALVHATMPVVADPQGVKTTIKRLIGKSLWTDAANARRAQYNVLVRKNFANAPILDIARVEASGPDGSLATFDSAGQKVETMQPQYTDDGGHLNELGRRKVAAEFLRVLADTLRNRPPAAS